MVLILVLQEQVLQLFHLLVVELVGSAQVSGLNNGGSGGGAAYTGAAGTGVRPGQGNDGGTGVTQASNYPGGGGGGKGGVGGNAPDVHTGGVVEQVKLIQ